MGLGASFTYITSREKPSAISTDGGVSRGSADWARLCSEWYRKYPSGRVERLSIDEPISTTTWRGLSDRGEEVKEERKEALPARILERIEEECLSDAEEDEEDSDASEDQSEGEADEVLEGVLPEAEERRSLAIGKAAVSRSVRGSKFVDDSAMEDT